MSSRKSGRVALVTGAAGGLGGAMTALLREALYRLCAVAPPREQNLLSAFASLRETNGLSVLA